MAIFDFVFHGTPTGKTKRKIAAALSLINFQWKGLPRLAGQAAMTALFYFIMTFSNNFSCSASTVAFSFTLKFIIIQYNKL